MLKRNGGAVAYQSTQYTAREADRLLDDLTALELTGVQVCERGSTYLVFAPIARRNYNVSLAVTLTIILAIGDLVATANSVVWIALLPLALVPFIPLLLDDRPQLAVGAVPGDGDQAATHVTVHGRVWGDLGAALDAYLSNLPLAAPAPARQPPANGAGSSVDRRTGALRTSSSDTAAETPSSQAATRTSSSDSASHRT
jgi:hypothetical protein